MFFSKKAIWHSHHADMYFKNRTALITGASRGIGKAIALKLAAEGANIVIAAKTVEETPKLEGTIFSAAMEIEKAGGTALPVQCDIRFEDQVTIVVQQAIEKFGGIDVLVNNASAISLTNTEKTEMKRYDLMYDINVRGTFLITKACVPFLKKASNPHILTLSPPLNLDPKWFAGHGCKFMPGENRETKKLNFTFFYNRVVLGDNTILVTTDDIKTAYLNYDVLDYMVTRDERFCTQCSEDLNNMMRKATVISQTSEKQRNIFFGILLAKVEDRLRKI